ncbi:hypothetical protein SPRG_22114 [Saprolegnia parasitica CBS 223.65]|uniref:Diacylglycerol kinase n=1 Tax=Saprolegnia parasitica (strain CBS 223.65) TaxID=695850 RepID=A0A067CPN6_SAPPC|nr:hypothetical protein SPRG_22114 [Saprolegnia parasitica CBS 223.65]KDO32483.1 hypothetical protein SPRG_22114 [Saprolegnia parasitica CBS 223.65]|eukprot:XP_012197073.1 hypothetical protein SPRG_22114 [Saprolegnia parasitica CBS 223.65]
MNTTIAVVVAAVIAVVVARTICLWCLKHRYQGKPYVLGRHQWRLEDRAGPHWCNVCDSVANNAWRFVLACDVCGKKAHEGCALWPSGGDQGCRCKVAANATHDSHLWVKNNFDSGSYCAICDASCFRTTSFQCAWCRDVVHAACGRTQTCGYGPHRRLVLAPTSVKTQDTSVAAANTTQPAALSQQAIMNLIRIFGSATVVRHAPVTGTATNPIVILDDDVDDVQPYTIQAPRTTTPLLVFINGKSGGQQGAYVVQQYLKHLNPLQIYDLHASGGPRSALIQFRHVQGLKIVVCGGDGTVGWVLGAIRNLVEENQLHFQPPVAILPLGTGNDLARSLNWGGGYARGPISDTLRDIANAGTRALDCWRITMTGRKTSTLQNYFSVGVDAQVALEFHEKRKNWPWLFANQSTNKVWYAGYGAKNLAAPTCANLETKIKLYCDGQRIKLPDDTEAVIVTNIDSYAGGTKLWRNDATPAYGQPDAQGQRTAFHPTAMDDGLLDVVAVGSTIQQGAIHLGLASATRVCQGMSIKLKLYINFSHRAEMLEKALG